MIDWKRELQICIEKNPEKNTSEAVYTTLLNAIISFKLKPGEKLVILNLSKEMGVSMTPVRDAIKRLGDDNLIKISEGKRAFVPEFDQEEYNKMQYYRQTLETLGAVLACEKASDEMIEKMCQCVEENVHIYETLRINMALHATLINKDLDFHRMTIHSSENQMLIEQYEMLIPRILFSRQFFTPLNFTPIEYHHLHRLIAQTLRVRDQALMRKVMDLHFRSISTASRLNEPIF